MPPDRSASKTKPFKPQRPSTGSTSSRAKPAPAPSSSRTTATTTTETPSSRPNPDDNDDENALAPDAPTETIPPALLTTLLTEFFADERTRISRGADKAVGKYMETFVREAIARAAYERGGDGKGDGFLEVEDLEKLAPQLGGYLGRHAASDMRSIDIDEVQHRNISTGRLAVLRSQPSQALMKELPYETTVEVKTLNSKAHTEGTIVGDTGKAERIRPRAP
ncbi:hypothetical protein V499_06751 [Pseudogymnoascus sp. VKM F-103]|nr:hypothetical protein V499_06751 [Pseudogymnoascus sp. VKM F-103]